MKIAKIVLFALLVTISGAVLSTAQVPDNLTIDGKQYPLNTNPLDAYLAKLGDKAPKFEATSTALWRGYVATWELSEGKLYLTKVEVSRPNPAAPQKDDNYADDEIEVDILNDLFPGKARVLADWYSGALIVPNGQLVEYVHMGYGSTYERYLVSTVKDGIEIGRRDLSGAEFRAYRKAKFVEFMGTPAYKAMFGDAKKGKDPMSDREIETFIFDYASETYLSVPDADPAGKD